MPELLSIEHTYYSPTETWLCDDGSDVSEIRSSAPVGSVAMVSNDEGFSIKLKGEDGAWRDISGSSATNSATEETVTLSLTEGYSSESNKILNGSATFNYTKIANRIIFDVTIGLIGVAASPSSPYLVEFEELPFYSGSIFDAPYYDFNNGQVAALARGGTNKKTMKLYVYKDYNNPGAQITISGSYRAKTA